MKKEAMRSLYAKSQLTGEDVGKAVIMDMIENYRSVTSTGRSGSVFTQNELDAMIHSLTDPHQTEIYNGYIALYNYTQKSQAAAISYRQEAQIGYHKLAAYVDGLNTAEQFRVYCSAVPVIMTRGQYESLPQSQRAEAEARGVAVIVGAGGRFYTDARGNYAPPDSSLLCYNSFESIYSDEARRAVITEAYGEVTEGLRNCMAYNVLYELIAERIGIEDFSVFSTSCDTLIGQIETLDKIVYTVSGAPYGTEEERAARRRIIGELFPPVRLDRLAPSEQARREVSAQLGDLRVFANINVRFARTLADSSRQRKGASSRND